VFQVIDRHCLHPLRLTQPAQAQFRCFKRAVIRAIVSQPSLFSYFFSLRNVLLAPKLHREVSIVFAVAAKSFRYPSTSTGLLAIDLLTD